MVVATVMAAFAGDPAWAFITAGDYDHAAGPFAAALFGSRVDSGHVWLADDGAGVAMWEPPRDEPEPGHGSAEWDDYRAAVGDRAWAALEQYDAAVTAVRPATPHWYLGVLATHPDRQGEGLATAVLAPVLARADADGIPCGLETSTTGNKAFYAGRGFTEATVVDLLEGPPTWWLTRPPVSR